ncbi:transposase [Rhodococcus oxybenzonivorans]|uniref:transposase n=1 Tax=Rhodococcus oxybenzonivorans TaxID=1990687 RepID=UPI0037CC3E99
MSWKYRTGAPWRDVPERFGKWNSIYERFARWAEDGTWEKLSRRGAEAVRRGREARLGGVDRLDHRARASARGDPRPRHREALSNHKKLREEPLDHGICRPRQRPDRVIADKGYPSKKNRARLRERKIAATIPERDDQIGHGRKKPGRPIEFGDEHKERYRGRNVVERCFNKLEQWRGIAMRSDKTARAYRAAITLAATLICIKTDLIHTA